MADLKLIKWWNRRNFRGFQKAWFLSIHQTRHEIVNPILHKPVGEQTAKLQILLPLITGGISCYYSSLSVRLSLRNSLIKKCLTLAPSKSSIFVSVRSTQRRKSLSSISASLEKWLVVTISPPQHSRLKVSYFSSVLLKDDETVTRMLASTLDFRLPLHWLREINLSSLKNTFYIILSRKVGCTK